jgi:hypothetical protein
LTESALGKDSFSKISPRKIGLRELNVLNTAFPKADIGKGQPQKNGKVDYTFLEMDGRCQYEIWPRNDRPVDANQFGIREFGISKGATLQIY